MDKTLVCKNEKSNKFWRIFTDAESFFVHYGKVDAFGQFEVKTFGDANECEKAANALIAEKLKKGYAENGATFTYDKNGVTDKIEESRKAKNEIIAEMNSFYSGEPELKIHIARCDAILGRFIDMLKTCAGDQTEIMRTVKNLVCALNSVEEDSEIIETDEREMIFEFIMGAATAAGLKHDGGDITEEWREW